MHDQAIRICTAAEMRDVDAAAEKDALLDTLTLMENAGRRAVDVLLEEYPRAGTDSEILVFAGKGNNAGDAFVVARHLLALERRVRVFLLFDAKDYQGPTGVNLARLRALKARILEVENAQDLEAFLMNGDGRYIGIDGILGTGIKDALEGKLFEVVETLNRYVPQMVALDIPTGVSGDTGAVHGTAVQAAVTVSFGFPKLGHFLAPGAGKRGKLINVDISLPPRTRRDGKVYLLTQGQMGSLIQTRDRYGHKNSFGHALLIGGAPGRVGAIVMAARACHKMGTGLVTVSTWKDALEQVSARIPDETMAFPVRVEPEAIEQELKALAGYSSIVIGPGLGQRSESRILVERVLASYQGPVVLDADALNVIAEHKLAEVVAQRRAPTVLTPHPGEMARLLGVAKEEVISNPIESLKKAVDRFHCVVLLKGAATLIASPDERVFLNHYPNDGMATAGSGDVLAGMLGGLVGQGMEPFAATQLAVFLHSVAGGLAAKSQGHRSMTARDIIENIGHGFQALKVQRDAPTPYTGVVELL